MVNEGNQLDVFGSPFYIGVTQMDNGNTAIVIAGPFSPGFAIYVSGLAEVVQSQDELRTGLAGHATEQQPSATEPLADDQTGSVPAEGGVFGIAQDGGDAGDGGGEQSGTTGTGSDDGSGSDGDSTGTDGAGDESAQEGDNETPQEDGDDTETPTDSGSGDADDDGSSGGGIFGWIFGLIIALVVAIGAYLLRNTLFGRSKRPEGTPTDGTGATPPPTLPDPESDTPTGGTPPSGGTPPPDDPGGETPTDPTRGDSHGDGPVIPAESDPPVVPVDTDPPPACDWELWFMEPSGWNKLREVAPGNTPCCIYKVTLGSSRDLAPAAGMRTDLPPGRIRTATANGTGTATSQSGSVSTGSRRDDATLPQDVLAALDAAGLPEGLERVEVAGLIEHDEHTSFTVEFESDCAGVTHRYTASGKAMASVGGQHRSDNRDPDNSTVELFTSGTVQADLTGDLSEMALARHGIDPDRHRLAPAGSVGVDDSDTVSADSTKDDTHWDSGFSTSVVVATGQLVPEENWPTTDEVETVAVYAASHEITLSGAATKGDCGADCCGGPCLCDPSFSLQVKEINGTPKQELVVDGTTWQLERQEFDEKGDAGWEATARPTLI